MKNNFLKSILLKMHKNGDIFSVDVYSDPVLQGSFILQYYVIGNTNSFNGSYPLYPAYRPYRYDFNPPEDRPFTEYYYISSNFNSTSTPLPKDSLQGCNGKKAQEKSEVIYKEPITLIGYFSKKLDNHTYAFTVDDGRKVIIGKGI